MSRRLLLISNSTAWGGGYLEHCGPEIRDFLGEIDGPVLFVPWALADHDLYTERTREAFAGLGYELRSIHESADPAREVERARAMFVGGGNTFRLLSRIYAASLIEAIRMRVDAGMPYIGSSAGSNVACITIRTTNDMPIVEPPSFDALALVPFNINPHYLDPDPSSHHMGETREERILQFLEENDRAVLGLREGSWLRVEGDVAILGGTTRSRLFRRGEDPRELSPGGDVSFLL